MRMLPTLTIHNNFEYLQNCVPVIETLLKNKKKDDIISIFLSLHPSVAASIFHFLSPEKRKELLKILDVTFDPEILRFLDETIKKELIDLIATHELAMILERLPESDAAEILENLTKEQIKLLLSSFNKKYRTSIEKSLNYPEESAGRIMDYNSITVPEEWTIGQIRNFIKTAKTLPTNLTIIFLINKEGQLTGQLEIKYIARLEKQLFAKNYSSPIEVVFNPLSSFEEIIFAFRQYGLYIAPVLNEKNELIGSIDITTVLDLMHEQAEDNLLNSVGIEESDFFDNILSASFNRCRWLGMTVICALGVGSLIDNFIPKGGASQYVTVIMATCGAAGIQVTTIIINAIFSRELGSINLIKTTLKEFSVALINGIIFSILTTLTLYLQSFPAKEILKFNAALIISLLISSMFGILLPLGMKKFGQDPTSGSSSILTAFTDTISVLMMILITRLFY